VVPCWPICNCLNDHWSGHVSAPNSRNPMINKLIIQADDNLDFSHHSSPRYQPSAYDMWQYCVTSIV
jgi:hypothetical protein